MGVMADLPTQATTIAGGVVGGLAGFFLGGGKVLWTGLGAFVGAVAAPPLVGAGVAFAQTLGTKPIALAPGKTVILRAQVGDLVTIEAPSGWGVPSATANIPGFLEVESTDPEAETTTLKVIEGGQGQIQMASGGEVAVLSIEA